MSDSQAYEEVHKSSDGVTVTKRFEEDEFPVPAIAFEFVSERDESVTVTLSDDVPESVAVEDLGFHPEYGSEYWTIDEDQITFERELDANAEYTTVYGIRATGTDDVEKFLTEPVLEGVDPPLPDDAESPDTDDVIPESDDEVVKDVIAGEGEVPGLEDEDDDAEAADEDIETLDLKDPNAPEGGTTTAVSDSSDDASSGDTGDGETAEVSVNGDSVVAAMAAEIRQEDVPVDDLKLVQRAIAKLSDRNGASAGGGVHDARVEKLQSDIADLRAYTDALEEFLEENGTGEQLIEDFQSHLSEFEDSLSDMESELDATTETVEEVREEMDGVTDEVESVSDDVDSLSEDIDDIERSLADVESTVDDLEDEVTDGDVADRIEDIEQELEDLREWQDQIKSTFGG